MIRASIIGVTGYTGIELLRLLHQHKGVEIKSLISSSHAGKKLTDIYPQFQGRGDYTLEEYNPASLVDSDIVFTALPHGVSGKYVAELAEQGIKIIDFSGDYRYPDTAIYEKWYGTVHDYPELARKAVYGLVELNREKIKGAELVANPGCYPTAALLGLLPLLEKDLIDENLIIVDAKSGVSGAGKAVKENLIFNEVEGSVKAYNINNHRHTSEIELIINEVSQRIANHGLKRDNTEEASEMIKINFIPHLVPMKRGILATIYTRLKTSLNQKKLLALYQDYYPEEGFVKVLPDGAPETKYVVGSNYCHLGVNYDPRTDRVVIVSVIDNLIKGASGQAVQIMNVMFDLPEKTGLEGAALFP